MKKVLALLVVSVALGGCMATVSEAGPMHVHYVGPRVERIHHPRPHFAHAKPIIQPRRHAGPKFSPAPRIGHPARVW